MICEQTRLLMFLCRNHSEIQIFQVHFSVFQLYLMCFLNFQKCSHLSDSRGKEWAGILMDVKVFSSVLCLLRIPPASSFKWDPAGSSLPQSTKVGKRGLSICHRWDIYASLQVLKSLQAQLHCLTAPWNKGKKPNKNPYYPAGLWIFGIPQVQVGFSVVFLFFKLFLFYPSVEVAVSRSKWKTFRNNFIRRLECDVVDV